MSIQAIVQLCGFMFVSTLLIANPVSNQDKPVNGKNVCWVQYSGGTFEQNGSKSWIEKKTGKSGIHSRFTETNRDDWSVYLCKTDGANLQIDLHTKKISYNGRLLYTILSSRATAPNKTLTGDYMIKSLYGGPGHKWYMASLSWDHATKHPMASVEFDDPVWWRFEPVSGKPNTYKIVNTHPGKWNGASLSWDHGTNHPMISVEYNDPVEWRLDPVPGKANTFKIVSLHPGKWYGASISWDHGPKHPMASLEFNDPVEWLLVMR